MGGQERTGIVYVWDGNPVRPSIPIHHPRRRGLAGLLLCAAQRIRWG